MSQGKCFLTVFLWLLPPPPFFCPLVSVAKKEQDDDKTQTQKKKVKELKILDGKSAQNLCKSTCLKAWWTYTVFTFIEKAAQKRVQLNSNVLCFIWSYSHFPGIISYSLWRNKKCHPGGQRKDSHGVHGSGTELSSVPAPVHEVLCTHALFPFWFSE